MHRPLVTLEVLAEALESGPPIPIDSRDLMEILTAQLIFYLLLGEEVANHICQSKSIERRFSSARRYLRLDNDGEDKFTQQVERGTRVVWLAEALYNLQTVEGYDRLLGDIQDGNLQASWEEAAFAMLLRQRGIPFRFLYPSKVPGEKTPDMEILLDPLRILCEVEGKDEHTAATARSVYNTLEHARKQLPSDVPGLICLKIPELWKGSPAIPTVFATISRFFHRTERVVAVIVRSERHSHKIDDPASPESAALLILRRNHSSKLLTPAVNAALDRIWDVNSRIGGTPLASVATVLHELNRARKAFLANPGAAQDFRAVRAAFIAGIREELAKQNPPRSN
jgi:hypothetical protein